MKRALICGISGQDGAYLAKHLLEQGYEVIGTSRDAETTMPKNLQKLQIADSIKIHSASLNDFRSVLQVLNKAMPDEIYNLAGQSSVGLSFEQPMETFNSITLGTLNLLEAVRFIDPKIKLYNASSSECFGDTKGDPANEETPFSPRSPYAVAKAAAFWYVANYREAYDLFACSGILFNHESPFRPDRFVTQKIINGVIKISEGKLKKLGLGNIHIARDWGWAPEYVDAMHRMLQQDVASDFVIATGNSHLLLDFVSEAFNYFGLNWEDHVEVNKAFIRPTDIAKSVGDPTKAHKQLGWKSTFTMSDIVKNMIEYKLGHENSF